MREWISKKLKNPDIKTLTGNFISLSALQLVNILLPLIILPYVLRVIGFDYYGVIVLATTLVTYFQSLTDYSFRITATRDVSVFRHQPQKLNVIYSKVLSVRMLFLAVSVIIITGIVLMTPSFYRYKEIYFLTVPMLLGNVLFPDWFFQGIEKMKYITYLNVGIKFFFASGVFIFIHTADDYWLYPLLHSAGMVAAGFAGLFILHSKYGIRFIFLKPRLLKHTIRDNFPIFVNQFLPTLYNNTSTFLVGLFTNTYIVGIYDAIKMVVNVCVMLLDILSRVFFPYLNRKKATFPKFEKVMIALGIILCVISVAAHPLIFWYLNVDYPQAFLILLFLSIGIIGYDMYVVYGVNYFIVRRRDKLVMMNTLRASLIGFVLAFPLIYYWGAIGAAINLSFTRLLMGGDLFLKKKADVSN